jgi:O-antigen/teichoic acid export membrane protein
LESEKTSGGDKYSKLAGNTIIFAISSFSSKLLTLIVQPFLTYAMAEISDLGLSKILSQYANLLIPFVSMGMSNAIIRFGLDKGNSEKQVFTNGLLTILGGFGILVLCWPVAQFLPDMAQYGLLIYIYVPAHPLHPVRAQPPVEQAGGRGRRALHRGDHGVLCALSGGL